MDKNTWLLKSKDERIAHLHEILAKLVELIKSQRDCIRHHIKEPPHTERRVYERKIMTIMEWEKEEHE